jgi:hypothetical protein
LMALAQAEASRDIEGARATLDARRAAIEEDLMTARTARDQALKRAEAADQALALFQTVATEERQGQAARIAERRLDAAIEARALAERTLPRRRRGGPSSSSMRSTWRSTSGGRRM